MSKNRGTIDGDAFEKSFTSTFNLNKNSILYKDYFNKLGISDTQHFFLVRVTSKQLSRLSNQKVMTRSDAYLIKSSDPKVLSLSIVNNGYLDEQLIDNLIYEKVSYSGISIKMSDSSKFQILKLTPNSFNTLFGNYELGAAISIYSLKENELEKNPSVLTGWHTTKEKMSDFFEINDSNFIFDLKKCNEVKKIAMTRTRELIDGSTELEQKIFNGIGLYDEPYTAHFFYNGDCIQDLIRIPYKITTGSGRSKGDFTVVLKP